MAADTTPTNFFGAGYSAGTNAITFNTSDHATPLLAELTDSEAAAATGDWRKIVFALMECLRTQNLALTPEDATSKVTINRSSYVDDTAGEIVYGYNITIRTTATGIEVSDE